MLEDFFALDLVFSFSINQSIDVFRSGIKMAAAALPMPALIAMKPASLPITSTKNRRSCEVAVSLILSMASMAVLQAVSNPIVRSVPERSLSMVPGSPMAGIPYSSKNRWAPVRDPSPPITTKASMPWLCRFSKAFFRPSGVLNSALRADFRNVPPRSRIWVMYLESNFLMSSWIIPS